MSYALWLIEFIFEALGARYSFRRIAPLCFYLGFRVLGDCASVIAMLYGPKAYLWEDLIQRTIQYPLLWILAVYLVGRILHEERHVIRLYAFMAGMFGIAAVIIFHSQGITWALINKFELCAQGTAAAMVATAFGMVELEQRARPERMIRLCGYAVIVKSGWDVLIAGGLSHGWHVAGFYPYGAILALGMWAFACAKKDSCGDTHAERRQPLVVLRADGDGNQGMLQQAGSITAVKQPAGMFSKQDESFLRSMRIRG